MAQYDGSIRILTKISTESAEKSLGNLSNTIKLTAKEISSLRSKMDALKGQKFYSDDYKKLQSDLALAEKKFAELVAKQDEWEKLGISSGGAWDTLNEEIIKASENISAIKEKMQQLEESGQAFKMGEETQEYSNLERQLQAEEEAIRKAQELQAVAQRTGDPYARLSQSLSELNKRLTSVLHPVEAMKSAFASAAETMKAKLAGIASSVINGVVHPFQSLKSAIKGTFSTEDKEQKKKSLLSKTMGLLGNAAKFAANHIKNSLASSLKRATSSMFGFGKSTKSSNNVLQSGFKNILKYGLGIRSFYMLVNKFRTAVKEGFGNLAQYSEPVNAALSSLKSALTQLKNSLATAFAPILTTIAPALTAFINMISKVVTYVGMLIAALTGQKTFDKAVAVQEDYAASLGKTASNAKKADKEQKKQLSTLDRLNNLTSPDDGSGSGESGGGGADGAGAVDMFETVNIPSQISSLADMIKKAWVEADFTEIGALIGTKLKEALENIPWDKIQQTAAKVGKSLATLINGFIEVEGLGYTIGKTIGEAINAGIIGINAFLDNTHWDSVGKFIGEGLNGIIDIIDWEALGHLFAAKWNAIFETIGNLVATVDWGTLGKNLAKSINKFIADFNWLENGVHFGTLIQGILDALLAAVSNIRWGELGTGIADALNGITSTIQLSTLGTTLGAAITGVFQSVIDFSGKYEWSALGINISSGLNATFESIDGTTVGKGLNDLVSGILTALVTAISTTDWSSVGIKVAQMINAIDWSGIIGQAVKGVSELAKGILDTLIGFVETLDWEKLGTDIWNSLVGMVTNIDWGGLIAKAIELVAGLIGGSQALLRGLAKGIVESLMSAFDSVKNYFEKYIDDAGGNIILGLFNGIIEAIKGIGGWIKEHIFDPFIKGFKKAFGIASPSKVMKEQGRFIMQGLINGISSLVNSVVEKFNFIKDKIVSAWDKAKEKTNEIWNNIKQKVSDTWNTMKQNASEKFNKMKESVVNAWNKAKEKTGDIWDGAKGIAESVKEKWKGMKESAENRFPDMRKSVVDAWDKAKEKTGDIWDGAKGIAESLKSKWKDMEEKASDRFPDMRKSVVDAWDKAKTKTGDIWDGAQGIAESLKSKWEDMKTNASSKFVDMKDSISGAWDELKKNTESVWENIKNAVKAPVNAIIGFINTFLRAMQKMQNGLADALNKISIDIPETPWTKKAHIGFNISKWTAPQIPLLATGAVIPPNREFLAVLGDQKHGRNLEAPEDLIRQIVREETASTMSGGEITIKIPVEIDGKTLFELMKKFDLEQFKRTRKPSFQM